DAVIMHDGASPIDAGEMRSLWRNWVEQTAPPVDRPATDNLHNAMRDLATLPAIHAAMENAHRRVMGFQLIAAAEAANVVAEETASPLRTSRSDAPAVPDRNSVGRIPRLPRPKFLSALANFAMGE